jgi:PAS domain S-box-containing protein
MNEQTHPVAGAFPRLPSSRRSAGALDSPSPLAGDVHFRQIVDRIPALIAVTTAPGEVEFVNLQALEYFGRTLEELKGWANTDAVHPADLPGVLAAWMQSVETGLAYDVELRLRRADGIYRWFHARGLPARDPDGRINRWYVLHTDIDERKRAEARQGGERRLLEMIASATPLEQTLDELCRTVERILRDSRVSILLFDPRGQRLRHGAGPSLPEGYTRAIADVPVDPGNGPCAMAAYLGEQVIVRDLTAEARWPRMRALAMEYGLRACWSTPIKSSAGRILGTFAIYADLPSVPTAQQHHELERFTHLASIAIERDCIAAGLHARQEMLDLAQKAAHAVAFEWHVGAEPERNRWSPDLEAMYGLSPGAYDGTYETWKKRVHPDDWPCVRAAITRAQETGDIAAEYRALHDNGAIRWLQAKGRMFFDSAGRPSRMVGFMLDVTERHAAEQELAKLEAQLRQAQRLEAMGTLAGGIAHDFNNLLGAILGYGEMAASEAPAGSRLRRDIENIMVAGERGRALVDRILVFSRSGVGERVPVDVQKTVRETLKLVAAKPPDRVRIEHRLRAARSTLMGDPSQIHQVLMNLVTNALRAMPSGGTLRVSLERVRIEVPRAATVGRLAAADYLVLKVTDNGTGIVPGIQDRIFDPFFTTKEVGVGTGLGLSLVHGIVSGLDGAIDVASTPGKGSVFTVYFPHCGEAAEVDRMDGHPAAGVLRGNGESILVVDDEAPLVDLLLEKLGDLGYAPVGFTSGSAALEVFAGDPNRFHAIVTDESMPVTSGSDLIRRIRKIRPEIPTLLVSGYVSSALTQRAREAGADEVLKKPLSTRELATALARVMGLADLERRQPAR